MYIVSHYCGICTCYVMLCVYVFDLQSHLDSNSYKLIYLNFQAVVTARTALCAAPLMPAPVARVPATTLAAMVVGRAKEGAGTDGLRRKKRKWPTTSMRFVDFYVYFLFVVVVFRVILFRLLVVVPSRESFNNSTYNFNLSSFKPNHIFHILFPHTGDRGGRGRGTEPRAR